MQDFASGSTTDNENFIRYLRKNARNAFPFGWVWFSVDFWGYPVDIPGIIDMMKFHKTLFIEATYTDSIMDGIRVMYIPVNQTINIKETGVGKVAIHNDDGKLRRRKLAANTRCGWRSYACKQ